MTAERTDRDLPEIGRSIQRAAARLPIGWRVVIELERDAGTVFLVSPDGGQSMIEDGEMFSDQINSAIDAAAMAEGGEQ